MGVRMLHWLRAYGLDLVRHVAASLVGVGLVWLVWMVVEAVRP